jgi:hypothetical protein
MIAVQGNSASKSIPKVTVVGLDLPETEIFPAKQLRQILRLRPRLPIHIFSSLRSRIN